MPISSEIVNGLLILFLHSSLKYKVQIFSKDKAEMSADLELSLFQKLFPLRFAAAGAFFKLSVTENSCGIRLISIVDFNRDKNY